jgi:hypothetical protein
MVADPARVGDPTNPLATGVMGENVRRTRTDTRLPLARLTHGEGFAVVHAPVGGDDATQLM